MESLKKTLYFSSLVAALLISNTAQSAMVEANFNWLGEAGYKAEGSFVYDDSLAKIDAQGWSDGLGNFNHGLNYLEIRFYNPSHDFLFGVIDVQAGIVSYSMLDFSFNPLTMAFEGSFDMGEDTGVDGEYYIWGTIGGEDSHLDGVNGVNFDNQASPIINVTSAVISEPGTIPMLLAGLFWLLCLGKRRRPCRVYYA